VVGRLWSGSKERRTRVDEGGLLLVLDAGGDGVGEADGPELVEDDHDKHRAGVLGVGRDADGEDDEVPGRARENAGQRREGRGSNRAGRTDQMT
jgi:hypothetical protein